MSVPDTSLVAFKAIVNFTTDLSEEFGEDFKPVKLYNHLLSKTTLAHDSAIQKHIDCFTSFIVDNRDQIASSDHKNISGSILYSSRVYLDVKKILEKADKNSQGVIWQHLLILSAILDPTGRAKQILKEQKENQEVNGEANFLNTIIDKIENNVDPNTSNPMEAVSSIMQSGVFNDLVQGMGSGLEDGSLDLNKLMGTVQNMVTKLNEDSSETEQNSESVNMINTMMQNLTHQLSESNTDDGNTQVPDLSNMLGGLNMDPQNGEPNIANMLGPMMSMMGNVPNMSNNSNLSIEEQINTQVEEAKQNGALK
jgi:hypothetical protein